MTPCCFQVPEPHAWPDHGAGDCPCSPLPTCPSSPNAADHGPAFQVVPVRGADVVDWPQCWFRGLKPGVWTGNSPFPLPTRFVVPTAAVVHPSPLRNTPQPPQETIPKVMIVDMPSLGLSLNRNLCLWQAIPGQQSGPSTGSHKAKRDGSGYPFVNQLRQKYLYAKKRAAARARLSRKRQKASKLALRSSLLALPADAPQPLALTYVPLAVAHLSPTDSDVPKPASAGPSVGGGPVVPLAVPTASAAVGLLVPEGHDASDI